MLLDPARTAGAPGARDGFVLYLEGPADRGILDGWCRRLLPESAARLSRSSVILGGRQPARAVAHFRSQGEGRRGLCVLDRDGGEVTPGGEEAEPGLEFFTWRRRHIESYLLVPSAIRRALQLSDDDDRVERLLREHLPEDEAEYRELDAKRLLAPRGPVARSLGRTISLPRVARATRASELHADVHAFFERVRAGLGVVEAVVVR